MHCLWNNTSSARYAASLRFQLTPPVKHIFHLSSLSLFTSFQRDFISLFINCVLKILLPRTMKYQCLAIAISRKGNSSSFHGERKKNFSRITNNWLCRLLLLSTLIISRSMDLWKITCISSFCSIDIMWFPPFTIFSFLLYLPISSYVYQTIKELCSSCSSKSLHFRHLSFNDIMKAIFLEYD